MDKTYQENKDGRTDKGHQKLSSNDVSSFKKADSKNNEKVTTRTFSYRNQEVSQEHQCSPASTGRPCIQQLLEENGRLSAGKRSRHLNIQFFFVTDMIKKGMFQVKYCPTGDMIADFFTKPTQGGTFKKFRKLIQNME